MNNTKITWNGLMQNAFTSMQDTYAKDEFLWQLLVKPFRTMPDGDRGTWKGEFWGKYMRGCAMICAYTQDEELYQVLERSVCDMLATQDELGRFSTYAADNEFHGWDIWCRKYAMLGMQYFLEICKDEALQARIITALKKHADYIIERVGYNEGQIPVHETSKAWGAANSASLLQPIVKLYKATKEERYLAWAKQLIANQNSNGENIFRNAFENNKAPFEYAVKKAYEMISCFEGLLEFYEATQNEDCLTACKQFADRLLETDFTIIGGVGHYDEFLDNGKKTQVTGDRLWAVRQETCVTVTLSKFLAQLYQHTGTAAYVDAIERAFYNLYLGAYNDGSYAHNKCVPIFNSYSPVYNNSRWNKIGGEQSLGSYAYFGCCIAIGFAGIGVVPWVALTEKDNVATIGVYEGGRYALNGENGAVFDVETEYPYKGAVRITAEKVGSVHTLRLRIPAWCEHFVLSQNGHTLAVPVQDGFVQVPISEGDAIALFMDMPYRIVPSAQVNEKVHGLFAVEKGPIVLCADSKEEDLYARHALQTDKDGYAVGESEDGKTHALLQADGKKLVLREYKSTAKEYHSLRPISVWLRK